LREGSSAIAHRKQYARSKLSNDAAMLQGVDQRTGPGRRFKDIVRAVIADQGGSDVVAEVRLQLIRRFAAEACLAEQLEARMALGVEIDIIEHCQLAGTMSPAPNAAASCGESTKRAAQRFIAAAAKDDAKPQTCEALAATAPGKPSTTTRVPIGVFW
jgi:hypothetical protein